MRKVKNMQGCSNIVLRKGKEMNIKRLNRVGSLDGSYYIDFIKENNLLPKFIIKHHILNKKASKIIVDDVDRTIKHRGYSNIINTYEKIVIDGDIYYLHEKWVSHTEHPIYIYKEIPLIINDENFIWKDNTKYNSKEAIITRGSFEYLCIVNADGNGKVIVRYTKGENFHRTRVTIAEFNVPNAYNEVFLEAIDKWTKEFKNSIAA